MNFGEYINLNRTERKMTQSQLAEKLGVSNTTISNYETGVSTPSFKLLLKMIELFGTPFDGLPEMNSLFCKAVIDVFSRELSSEIGANVRAVRASAEFVCPEIQEKDYVILCPVESELPSGKVVYYDRMKKKGVYKLYHKAEEYILMPHSQRACAPIHIQSADEYLFEIKAILRFF